MKKPVSAGITQSMRLNFKTLKTAACCGDLVLQATRRRADDSPAVLICAVNRGPDDVVPLAELLVDDPAKIFLDPATQR